MKQFGNPILMGLLAGIVAGVLYASLATGSASGLLLFYITPLPVFIAGFGWAMPAALAAALSGTLLGLALVGPLGAFTFACGIALPGIALTHFAFLCREAADKTPAPASGVAAIEWYPVGNLLLLLALIGGILATVTVVFLGPSYEAYASGISLQVDELVKKATAAGMFKPMTGEQISTYKQMVIALLPPSTAIMWILIAIINAWAAGHVVRVSGLLRRPWPDISDLRLPRAVPVAFGMLLAVPLLLGGFAELVVSGFAAALAASLLALGLAIAHHVSRGHPLRGLFLFATYAAAFLIGWGAFLLIFIGLLDPYVDFRRAAASKKGA